MRSHPARAKKNPERISLRSLLGLAGLLAFVGNCSSGDKVIGPDNQPATVASVSISGAPESGAMMVGDRATLTATPRDVTGAVVTAMTSWSSSNPSVVSVANGEIQAIGAGEATITASAGGRSATTDLVSREPLRSPAAGETQSITTTTLGGAVSMTIPPAAVPAGVALGVTPAIPGSVPASANLVAGTAFSFFPSGAQFASPLTLMLRFPGAGITAEERAGLALYLATATGWQKVPGSGPVAGSDLVSGSVSHFSTYAVLRRAAPTAITLVAGGGQTGSAGTTLPTSPAVLVSDANGAPIEGVAVAFAVVAGGGAIGAASVATDATGRASPGAWTIGQAGQNSLTATVAGLPPLTINATATAPLLPTIVLSASTLSFSWDQGSAAPASQSVSVTSSFGNVLTGVSAGPVSYGAGASGWLTAIAQGTSTPSTIVVALQLGGLTTGTYTATVPVSAAGAAGPRTVTVTLQVRPGPPAPIIRASPAAVGFDFANANETTSKFVNITGEGTVPLVGLSAQVTAWEQGDSDWLTLSLEAGSPPVRLELRASTSASVGTHVARVTIRSTTPGVVPVTITVSMSIPSRPATAMSLTGAPTIGFRNVALDVPPTIRLTADDGLPAMGGNVTVTASVVSGTGTLAGNTSMSSNGGSVVSFSGLRIDGAGVFVLRFSAPGLTPVTTAPITVYNARPAQVTVLSGENHTGKVGSPLLVPITVQVLDALSRPIEGIPVNFSLSGLAGTLGSPSTLTDGTGLARTSFTPLAVGTGTILVTGPLLSFSPLFTVGGALGDYFYIVHSLGFFEARPGESHPFQATLFDPGGLSVTFPPEISRQVTWSSSPAGPTFATPTTGLSVNAYTTNSATFPATVGSWYLVSVTDAGGIQTRRDPGELGVRVIGGASPTASVMTASATSVPANGTSTVRVTLTLKNPGGSSLPANCSVAVTITRVGTGTLGPTTKGAGCDYGATLTAPAAPGSATMHATIDGIPFWWDLTVSFTSVSAALRSGPPDPPRH
jgi:hypothetical protein